ncbi:MULTISPECIES: MarR family transcriptional regulator [Streptomyces]|uniref:MarR family transcriptional regulator n=2 Tax=Streptomyces TaxID=1883 RepID=A0A2N8P866_STRNR|nr:MULTISPECIES: MarR family transcriptional regulator [Streptomyces]AJC53457.1 MarR family transcriptional regulator [Streptomyces sp. 769]PNE37202.1 MarR family transcriptional regulator [Streptomyces noursei]WEB38470.1 MarR family transcriptional regulator [Streptomyces yunnanensis]
MTRSADVDDVAGALYDSLGLLARRLRQMQAPGDLSLPERAALARLDRGGPATAAELARAEQITSQAMGTTLGLLEERGLVERRRDPHDGRRIILSLTEAGVEMLRHKRDARGRQLAKALGEHFTDAELATLKAAAPLIERLGDSL